MQYSVEHSGPAVLKTFDSCCCRTPWQLQSMPQSSQAPGQAALSFLKNFLAPQGALAGVDF